MSNLLYTTAALLTVLFNEVNGHGYLASPRSRNLVAYEVGSKLSKQIFMSSHLFL